MEMTKENIMATFVKILVWLFTVLIFFWLFI